MSSEVYRASVPSNIAFLKYWGKSDPAKKWPTNNSLSMTLDKCRTSTSCFLDFSLSDFEIFYDGKKIKEGDFFQKIRKHLCFLKSTFDFPGFLRVETSNNFPTASGVASSASGFAALTLASVAAWTSSSTFLELSQEGFSIQKLSSLSRLGSGSACRSLLGGFVLWEKGPSPDEQRVKKISCDWPLMDILIVLKQGEKKLSSTEAHVRVPSSPLFSLRMSQIEEKQKDFEEALKEKNIKKLGALLEQEALEIHAVIMTAEKPFSYLLDETVAFLSWMRQLRQKGLAQVYFTLDAGSNVHVICEEREVSNFLSFLKRDFPNLAYIKDNVGKGPLLTSSKA